MPMQREKYPQDWEATSLAIRARADWHCERCGIAHRTLTARGTLVILTVMHLNHDTTDNRPENLQAACQRCHLVYDARLHAQHAAETRRKKQETAGQLRLLEGES